MNRDDPFAEPSDTERTIIRPNPGGRRPSAPAPMPPPVRQDRQPVPAPVAAAPTASTGSPVAAAPPPAGALADVAVS
ncbi:MAG: type VI secretion system protein TssL, partial [Pseudomonadota bacterium]